MDDITITLRKRALEWLERPRGSLELTQIGIQLANEYTHAANEIERLRETIGTTISNAIPQEWDGEWLMETLPPSSRLPYETKVAGLRYADVAQFPLIAREIFQMGYYHALTVMHDEAQEEAKRQFELDP